MTAANVSAFNASLMQFLANAGGSLQHDRSLADKMLTAWAPQIAWPPLPAEEGVAWKPCKTWREAWYAVDPLGGFYIRQFQELGRDGVKEHVWRAMHEVCNALAAFVMEQETYTVVRQTAARFLELQGETVPDQPFPKLAHLSRQMAEYMRLRESAKETAFMEAVWGKDAVSESALKSAISRFNSNPHAPFQLSREDGRVLKIG